MPFPHKNLMLINFVTVNIIIFWGKKKWVWACLWILYSLTLHVFLFNTGGIAGGIFSSSSRDDFNNVTVSLICPSVEEDGLELSSEVGTSKHIIIF